MRQLTEAEREALGKAMKQAFNSIHSARSDMFFEDKFEAGFIAGLDHAQAKIEALETLRLQDQILMQAKIDRLETTLEQALQVAKQTNKALIATANNLSRLK